ncbi:MAG: hypothetical protein EA379_01895 [Phycisphaerales bacterium]|nr:MAG: hypothetical protein EA379_01895 [Phycisphaerales bacterium]
MHAHESLRGRTLHLVEAHACAWATLDALHAARGDDDAIWAFGPPTNTRALRAPNAASPHPPLQRPEFAWRTLRDRVRRDGAPALIHCWSWRCLMLARLGAPRARRVASLFEPPPVGALSSAWARGAIRGVTRGTFGSHALRDAWSALAPRTRDWAVAPAPVDPAQRCDADACRRRWGVRDGQRVVAFIGSRSRIADAPLAAYYLGLLTLSGADAVGVIPHDAHDHERTERFTERHGRRWRMLYERLPERDWIGAADVVVAVSPPALPAAPCARDRGDACAALAWAAALRTPIIAADSPGVRSLLDEGSCAMLDANDRVGFAGALRDFLETGPDGAKIDRAETLARERCDGADFARAMRALRGGDAGRGEPDNGQPTVPTTDAALA